MTQLDFDGPIIVDDADDLTADDGDGVWRHTRRTGIVGYGYPAHQGVSVSQDASVRQARDDTVRRVQSVVHVEPDGDGGRVSRAALDATVRARQAAWHVPANGDWGPRTDGARADARRRFGRGL